MKLILILLSSVLISATTHAIPLELTGLVGYDVNLMSNKPSNTTDTHGGVTYGFSARTDFFAGKIETGFLYTPLSITTTNPFLGDEKSSGAYWIVPLLYRFDVFPPFLTLAFGPDYAVVGNNTLSLNAGNYTTSAYNSHFGGEVSAQGVQDLGENLSAVLDIRYRAGFSDAITINNQGTKFNFLLIAFGLQKRLE